VLLVNTVNLEPHRPTQTRNIHALPELKGEHDVASASRSWNRLIDALTSANLKALQYTSPSGARKDE